jgi:hypothetical protein
MIPPTMQSEPEGWRLKLTIEAKDRDWKDTLKAELGEHGRGNWLRCPGRVDCVLFFPGRPSGGPASLRMCKWLLVLAPSLAASLSCVVCHWGESLTTMEVACLDCWGEIEMGAHFAVKSGRAQLQAVKRSSGWTMGGGGVLDPTSLLTSTSTVGCPLPGRRMERRAPWPGSIGCPQDSLVLCLARLQSNTGLFCERVTTRPARANALLSRKGVERTDIERPPVPMPELPTKKQIALAGLSSASCSQMMDPNTSGTKAPG